MAKMFDGKKVYDRESFSYEQAKIGDYVKPAARIHDRPLFPDGRADQ